MDSNKFGKFSLIPADSRSILEGLAFAVVVGVSYALWKEGIKNGFFPIILSSIIPFFLTVFVEMILCAIYIRINSFFKLEPKINKMFWDTINMLGSSTNEDKKRKKLKNFLTYSYSANQEIQFNPDDKVVESLWQCDALLAFTCAHPSAWFDPTFNFYLQNNYLRNLLGNLSVPTIYKFAMCHNRSVGQFGRFISDDKKKELDALGKYELNKLRCFTNRFYFLSHDAIVDNASLISNMLSGHDLCGCHLHLIKDNTDENGYPFVNDANKNPKLYAFLQSVGWKSEQIIDFAIAVKKVNNKKINLSILYRGADKLEEKQLTSEATSNFKSFLEDLCSNRRLYDPPFHDVTALQQTGTARILPQNNEFVHIYRMDT